MRVFVTGGTGFVGTYLTGFLTGKGHEVTILTRPGEKRRPLPPGGVYLEGDPTRPGTWQGRVPGHDGIVNLAGASIFSRWTAAKRKILRDSRILTTRHLAEALAACTPGRPVTLLSTSAVGYYGFHEDEELVEEAPAGTDFLAELAAAWEAEAYRARRPGVRVLTCRFGIVLGRRGGALGPLVPLFRWYGGSPVGSGRQWFSWIHEEDLARAMVFLLERPDLEGPVNFTAPQPVRNGDFTQALGRALKVPLLLPPVPGFLMRLVLGEFGGVILKGQRVVPRRLLQEGFPFLYPEIGPALENLVRP